MVRHKNKNSKISSTLDVAKTGDNSGKSVVETKSDMMMLEIICGQVFFQIQDLVDAFKTKLTDVGDYEEKKDFVLKMTDNLKMPTRSDLDELNKKCVSYI